MGWLAWPAAAQVPDLGPPLAVVTLRIGPAQDAGFLHDLADYTNRYGFQVTGRRAAPCSTAARCSSPGSAGRTA